LSGENALHLGWACPVFMKISIIYIDFQLLCSHFDSVLCYMDFERQKKEFSDGTAKRLVSESMR
jgi:hypothetical protein